jgi:hypothetical protein
LQRFSPLETYTQVDPRDLVPLFQKPEQNGDFIQSHGVVARVFIPDSTIEPFEYPYYDKDEKNNPFSKPGFTGRV